MPIRLQLERLGLVAPPAAAPPSAEEPAVRQTAPPIVDLVAYAEDCVLSGRLALTADRLTDLLNDHEEFVFVDALVESLADGHMIERREVAVGRDELLIVQIAGPRGDSQRRQRTRQHPIAMKLGPYDLHGYLHTLPGSDPIASLRHRRPMVPLTEASIEYSIGVDRHRRQVSAVLVNRDQLDSVVEATDEEVEMPDIPFGDHKGVLLKDFTGSVHSDGEDQPTDSA